MKKTNTYQLNQWELSDRIRMEDFNADNLRLETALGRKLAGFQKIGSYPSGAGANNTGAATFTHDWNAWECVMAAYDIHKTAFLDGDYISIAPIYTDESVGSFVEGLGGGSFFILLFPFRNEEAALRGFAVGKGGTAVFEDRPFKDMQGFSIRLKNPSSTHPLKFSNTTFTDPLWTVYGLK